ncbi:venom peptide La1-like [Macrosteles quadrilineatus]|uniref:venom peptide La1-like n=1 Tax=Macrosteles quadrilineatus TaxID=74068 RepID=UPI0023E0EB30|nr:venom peptide La1-like [Macrosteles quadrilineatus]
MGATLAGFVKQLGSFTCKKEFCVEGSQRYTLGRVWYDKVRCERKTCMKGGRIQVESCPIIREQSGCEVVQGTPQTAFPECCDTLSCWKIIHSDPVDEPVL